MTSPLGDELVKQNGTSAKVDAELGKLRQVIEAEQQRAKRLGRWTKIVWITAVAMLFVPVALSVLYMALSYKSSLPPEQPPAASAATQPTTQALAVKAAAKAAEMREHSAAEMAMKAIITTVFLLSLPLSLLLMLIGIVMMVLTFVARRTAGMHEIRASLASIDAQLRMMSVPPTKTPPSGER